MDVSEKLKAALVAGMSADKEIEVTYRDGSTVSGSIKNAFSAPSGVVIDRKTHSAGGDRYHTIDFRNVVKIVIDSRTYR